MLKKYAGQLFLFVLIYYMPIFAFAGQGSMDNPKGKHVMTEIVITIHSQPTDKITLTKERLQRIGREIIEKSFPEDLAKSGQVTGTITLTENRGDNVRFELMGLFLYRETYTAVTHKVLFSVSRDSFVIISIDGK